MKILYAIQATGNGHISRATELMPFLNKYGKVDVFLSGNNSSLAMPFDVKYKSKGVSLFYGNTGGLDYFKMLKAFSPTRIVKEALQLPVKKYDIVINDFESITSLACRLQKVPSIHFGHQASFVSKKSPRPSVKNFAGELVLNHYAKGTANIGLHFEQYDDFIFSPILKENILQVQPINNQHITVYLSHYNDDVVAKQLLEIPQVQFHLFSKQVKQITNHQNIIFFPVNNHFFIKSLIECQGVITGAGFETPAEALYLGKKLLCLPIKGQYEQLCNAEALKHFNVPIITSINHNFIQVVNQWLNAAHPQKLVLLQSTQQIVQHVIEIGLQLKQNKTAFNLNNLLSPTDLTYLPQLQ